MSGAPCRYEFGFTRLIPVSSRQQRIQGEVRGVVGYLRGKGKMWTRRPEIVLSTKLFGSAR